MEFTSIDNSGRIEGFCLIKTAEQKTSSKGDTYLDLTLSDKSGDINGKIWRYSAAEYGEYKSGDLVKVRGTLSKYNGVDQLRIEKIRCTIESDNVKTEDFVKSSAFCGEEMFAELLKIVGSFKDNELKTIVSAIYNDKKEQLLFWPAAHKLHHTMRGGLLMHTLSIVRLCQGVIKVYPFIDGELLIAGAMLHDIAKLEEFEINSVGTVEGYSVKGNLLGHLTMGARTVHKYAEKFGISEKTATLLEHMILSHHGLPEYGAAVRPMIIEAELLSELDLMDARIYEMKEALLPLEKESFSGKMWALDNVKVFNHARKDLKEEPNLI